MKKWKNPAPLRKAIYSIQFYRDKKGVLNVTETCQGGDLNDLLNMYGFGQDVCKSDFLDKNEKASFASFCQGYIEQLKKE